MKIVLCQQKTLFEKPHIKFTKEWITCHTTSHFFLIYLKKKMEFWSLQNPNIRPPPPLAGLTAKSWHIHTLHTLWAPLNTEQWVDTRQKTLHTLMCVSAGTQSWHWQIKKEGSHQQYSAYSVIKTQCSSQQSQNGQEKLGAVCSRGELACSVGTSVCSVQCGEKLSVVCNVGRQ